MTRSVPALSCLSDSDSLLPSVCDATPLTSFDSAEPGASPSESAGWVVAQFFSRQPDPFRRRRRKCLLLSAVITASAVVVVTLLLLLLLRQVTFRFTSGALSFSAPNATVTITSSAQHAQHRVSVQRRQLVAACSHRTHNEAFEVSCDATEQITVDVVVSTQIAEAFSAHLAVQAGSVRFATGVAVALDAHVEDDGALGLVDLGDGVSLGSVYVAPTDPEAAMGAPHLEHAVAGTLALTADERVFVTAATAVDLNISCSELRAFDLCAPLNLTDAALAHLDVPASLYRSDVVCVYGNRTFLGASFSSWPVRTHTAAPEIFVNTLYESLENVRVSLAVENVYAAPA